ncbi:hypothetical protein ABPG72_016326 [Tetrahymena utriculariae]
MSIQIEINQEGEASNSQIVGFFLERGYKIIKQIGKGYYGVVYKALQIKDNVIVAIKGMVFNTQHERQKLMNEFQCLKSIDHPNVIKVFEYIAYPDNSCGFYSMEFCQSDLAEVLEKHRKQQSWLNQEEIYYIASQILQGLKAIHQRNIIHFNISCENILLGQDGQYKIGDFGECKRLNQGENSSKTHGECSRKYGSPEQLHKLLQMKDIQEYTQSSDIYSLGIVYYYLTNRTIDYEHVPIFKKVEFHSFLNPEYSQFNKLISQMIQFRQEDRVKLHSAENALSFLIQNNNQTSLTQIYQQVSS